MILAPRWTNRMGLLGFVATLALASAQDVPRERVPLDGDWRFTHDDPADAAGQLDFGKVKALVEQTGADLQAATPTEGPLPAAITGAPGGDVSYAQPTFDDSGWRQLNLPHDWGIEGPFKEEYSGNTGKLPYWGVGWYRKHFKLSPDDQGRQMFLNIDGAMSHSLVWLNGHFVGGWPYGYTSYQLELTPYLNTSGDNVVAVRLDNPNNSSRWYPGGGIYRHVWLVKTGPVHVANNGTYLTTPTITPDSASIDLKVSVDNEATSSASVAIATEVHELSTDDSKSANVVAQAAPVSATIPAGTRQISDLALTVPKPKLWDVASPNRYVAVTTLTQGGRVVDRYETPFGIRTIKFDPENGFFLNGKHVEINGTCNHADLGALGTAINKRALQRQLEILKEMGCNAIRTSHNCTSSEQLDLCDKMGFVVMDEAFDTWTVKKTANDYHTLFPVWHSRDLRSLIRRDRNHPCVILWSVGNEVSEQHWSGDGSSSVVSDLKSIAHLLWNSGKEVSGQDGKGDAGLKIARDLRDIARSEDLTRPVTVACDYPGAGFNGFQKEIDLLGYNYKFGSYEKFHQVNPTEPVFGSETASTLSSRGEYFFPPNSDKTNFQVSSYDLTAPGWASPPDPEFKIEAKFPFVLGQFLWAGFDYLGEPTPYNNDATNLLNFTDPAAQAKMAAEMKELGRMPVPSRSSYFGAIDLAGFKKDLFYFFQAAWRPDFPMAHILPHWNWPERLGLVTPVFVYTSGDEAELFFNGESLGRKKKGDEFRLRWDEVKYAPGELKVVAYKNGEKWAEDSVKTTGPAAKLTLTADRTTLTADGSDLSYITVSIADKEGLVVPRTDNLVQFEITGPGEIIATDNGDATSLEPFQAKERKAFNGLALVIVRTKAGEAGAISVKAKSEGLDSAEVDLTSAAGAAK